MRHDVVICDQVEVGEVRAQQQQVVHLLAARSSGCTNTLSLAIEHKHGECALAKHVHFMKQSHEMDWSAVCMIIPLGLVRGLGWFFELF